MTIPEATTRGTNWLTGAGLRPTRQRVALATLLVGDGQHRHVTAESLFADVQRMGESVSLATVYNTLRAFCDAGLVQEVTPAGEQADKAIEIATTIAQRAPLGVRATIESARTTLHDGPDAAAAALLGQARALMASEDAKEGLQSFVERRDAEFRGK